MPSYSRRWMKHYVEHGNMTANGNPIPDLLSEDKYTVPLIHKRDIISGQKCKWKIHSILGITAAQSQFNFSILLFL
jgi:hypothetical protein